MMDRSPTGPHRSLALRAGLLFLYGLIPAALALSVHLNRIVIWSFIFFGTSIVLFGVVRATGAVMAPLIILIFSLIFVLGMKVCKFSKVYGIRVAHMLCKTASKNLLQM